MSEFPQTCLCPQAHYDFAFQSQFQKYRGLRDRLLAEMPQQALWQSSVAVPFPNHDARSITMPGISICARASTND